MYLNSQLLVKKIILISITYIKIIFLQYLFILLLTNIKKNMSKQAFNLFSRFYFARNRLAPVY